MYSGLTAPDQLWISREIFWLQVGFAKGRLRLDFLKGLSLFDKFLRSFFDPYSPSFVHVLIESLYLSLRHFGQPLDSFCLFAVETGLTDAGDRSNRCRIYLGVLGVLV